jgi:hypothetical protein
VPSGLGCLRALLRPGGLVVFHDTCNPDEPEVRAVFEAAQVKSVVDRAWESRGMNGNPKGRGIGVVHLPNGIVA